MPAPTVEIGEPFSLVQFGKEYAPGKLLTIDALEATLIAVDFEARTRQVIGRQGTGPGEYRAPAGAFELHGDSIWILDPAQARIVTYNPDLTPGNATIPFIPFNQQTSAALTAPFAADTSGRMYASAMHIQIGQGGGRGAVQLSDSVDVVRFDPRAGGEQQVLDRLRFPTGGNPQVQQAGSNALKFTMPFPGLINADAWTVFPNGRVAIVRGAGYTVEFIEPDGSRTTPVAIPYDRIPVTEEDKAAEMARVEEQMAEGQRAAQRMMPANISMTFEVTPPESWPEEYPPISPLAVLPAPDGSVWIRRATPVRLDRERWDVVDSTGQLVARWQLPARTTLIALGAGGVAYTVRTDDDDLRWLQRVQLNAQ